VLSLAFACAGAKPPFGFKGPPPENAHDRAMARFADRYLDASLRLKPVTASSLGYRKYDRALPEWSAAGSARAAAALHALERELLRIDVNKLSLSYAIDHELIARELAKDLFAIETLQDHTFDVQKWGEAIGGAFYYLTIPPEKTEEWPARLESVLARMAALPRFLEDAKKTLVAPPRIATEFVIGQGPGHVDTFESQLPKLFEPYPALKARFEAEQPKTVKALRDFFAWLESDLSARSTGDYRLGKERFEKKLADTLASEMKAEEIYRAAEGALEATRFEMYDLALPIYAQLFPGDQAFRALAGDERINLVVGRVIEKAALEHGTAESLFDDVRAISAELKKFIREKELIALPPEEDRFVIERTPAFLDGLAVAFYNPAPAFQPDLTKAFWISTVPGSSAEEKESFLREYNRHTLLALVIHEAFPGHYVQAYWSSHSAHASIVKSVLESGTMAEGWAVMIEELLHREGLSASDPKARLFHLKMRLRVFANAMIDVRLHTGGEEEALAAKWAMDLMRRKAFQEEAEAARKLRRAKLTSTQLSTYFVGYREMIGLYESMLAKKVAPRDALAKMISFGTIPPAMIRKMVDMNR
jgi:uncharacterized protein (DUF885 family)